MEDVGFYIAAVYLIKQLVKMLIIDKEKAREYLDKDYMAEN